jgi:hypothetical protein
MTIALACTVGLHWSLLQSVAWTTMFLGNLQSLSISEAVARAFDGKHPCSLCKVIAQGKKSEKNSDSSPSFKKFDGLQQASGIVIMPPAAFPRVACLETCHETLAHAPPAPPPRLV